MIVSAKFTRLWLATKQIPCLLRPHSRPPCISREARFCVQGGVDAEDRASFPAIWARNHCPGKGIRSGGLGRPGLGNQHHHLRARTEPNLFIAKYLPLPPPPLVVWLDLCQGLEALNSTQLFVLSEHSGGVGSYLERFRAGQKCSGLFLFLAGPFHFWAERFHFFGRAISYSLAGSGLLNFTFCQDGQRSDWVKSLAKKTAKQLRIGKPDGPPKYTELHELSGLGLNQREAEALNLNFASLCVTGLLSKPRIFQSLGLDKPKILKGFREGQILL